MPKTSPTRRANKSQSAARLRPSARGFIDYGLEPQAIIVDGTPYDERLMRLVLS